MANVDSEARVAAYRRQNGRESLTPRQYRRWDRKLNREIRADREAVVAIHQARGFDTSLVIPDEANDVSEEAAQGDR